MTTYSRFIPDEVAFVGLQVNFTWITLRSYHNLLSLFFLQDWIDIDFGIAEGVDFIAISFVRTAEVIKHLKSYIRARSPNGYV